MGFPVKAGGTGNDYGGGITSLADGSSIVSGYFSGTASFGDTTLNSAGGFDPFIAKSFLNSTEFLALMPSDSPNNQFVQILYQHCFERSAEATGLGFWTEQLDTGLEDRAGVFIGFANSPENAALLNSLLA